MSTHYNAISDQSSGMIRPTVSEKNKHGDTTVRDLIRTQKAMSSVS